MAFKTPPDEAIAWADPQIPRGVDRLIQQHDSAVAALLEAAEAAAGAVDTAVTLAAIKEYRTAMAGTKEEPGPRDMIRTLAYLLITVGVAPGRVCRGLGFGRTAMNKAMIDHAVFKKLIGPGTKSMKKAVA
ncbi:Uncharacterised protein [Mycobacteroides abscessus]|uniref:hypothetical protein n=1 Tax=Mycobacteroides abscessus TaxID=36809 RepID=UPI0005DED346|nr:hypothetical protein [Mycobacteroides abscessus]CPS10986.1 Uncharacterised protein [Mycobacteroides abscessus]CPS50643.1 Uncharacterised protein [Mycobacteroides abscessus]CPS93542.1 Uncharacterised protein [Mycobacteroides abscessus]CPS94416.1 Uncharacterised protein [Mycobacteroides abscessus]CPT61567.1 Uncharacterised protein [Mycobacteroides abscessus]